MTASSKAFHNRQRSPYPQTSVVWTEFELSRERYDSNHHWGQPDQHSQREHQKDEPKIIQHTAKADWEWSAGQTKHLESNSEKNNAYGRVGFASSCKKCANHSLAFLQHIMRSGGQRSISVTDFHSNSYTSTFLYHGKPHLSNPNHEDEATANAKTNSRFFISWRQTISTLPYWFFRLC